MDNYIGEIRAFGFAAFAPRGWAFCNGQLLAISQNTALFSLLGVSYGGDGRVNFGLPDLRGSTTIGQGQSPGTSYYIPGSTGGDQSVTLAPSEMPVHAHDLNVSVRSANQRQPGGFVPAVASGVGLYNTVQSPTTVLDPTNALAFTGGNLPHNNLMPYQTVSFCIALQGIFPPRGGLGDVQLMVREPGGEIEVVEETEVIEDGYVVFGPIEVYEEEGEE